MQLFIHIVLIYYFSFYSFISIIVDDDSTNFYLKYKNKYFFIYRAYIKIINIKYNVIYNNIYYNIYYNIFKNINI